MANESETKMRIETYLGDLSETSMFNATIRHSISQTRFNKETNYNDTTPTNPNSYIVDKLP